MSVTHGGESHTLLSPRFAESASSAPASTLSPRESSRRVGAEARMQVERMIRRLTYAQDGKLLPSLGISALLLALALLAMGRTTGPAAYAASVPPVPVEGNPTCASLNPTWNELEIDPPASGTFSDTDANPGP